MDHLESQDDQGEQLASEPQPVPTFDELRELTHQRLLSVFNRYSLLWDAAADATDVATLQRLAATIERVADALSEF